MDKPEAIWITGVGAATPLGCGLTEIEANLLAGRSGVSRVTRFPTQDYPSQIAAQLGRIPCPPGCDPRAFAAGNPLDQLMQWCAAAALHDAGWWGPHRTARVGLAESLATPGSPAPRTIATDARGRLRVELQGGQAVQLDAIGSTSDSQSVGLPGLRRSAPHRIPRGVRRVG